MQLRGRKIGITPRRQLRAGQTRQLRRRQRGDTGHRQIFELTCGQHCNLGGGHRRELRRC